MNVSDIRQGKIGVGGRDGGSVRDRLIKLDFSTAKILAQRLTNVSIIKKQNKSETTMTASVLK